MIGCTSNAAYRCANKHHRLENKTTAPKYNCNVSNVDSFAFFWHSVIDSETSISIRGEWGNRTIGLVVWAVVGIAKAVFLCGIVCALCI